MPIIYTPIVGEACQNMGIYFVDHEGSIFQNDKGNIRNILKNWSNDNDVIVVTDGERILD